MLTKHLRSSLARLSVLLILTACSSATGTDPTIAPKTTEPPLPTVASAPTTIVLEWWDYYDLIATSEAIDTVIAQYEAEHPRIDIQRKIVSFNALKSEIIRAANQGETPDIILVDNPDHQSLAAQGALADLTHLISGWPDKAMYVEGAWASTIYQGRNYGVPFESNALALFYNVDLFADAGLVDPPQTWDELRVAAQRLTTTEQYGVCWANSADEMGTFSFLPFLWQAGGDVSTIGDAASIEALRFVNTLANVDRSAPNESLNEYEMFGRFLAGQCAMIIDGPWIIAAFEEEYVAFDWQVAPLPRGTQAASVLGDENFAIGAGSNVDEAWAVITWMSQPEHLKAPLLTVGLPNRHDMANDAEWYNDPTLRIFVEQITIARPRAYGQNYPQISAEIQRMFRSVLESSSTPEQAAAKAQAGIVPLLP